LKKFTVSGGLFWFQIFMGLIFIVPQTIRMLSTVQGLTTVLYLSFEFFIGLNFWLAIKAYREVQNVETKQTLAVYSFWGVGVTLHLIIMLVRGHWTNTDTMMMMAIGIASAVTLLLGGGVTNPTAKGVLALWCKAIPQFYLAYCIYKYGGQGLAAITVWAGHVTVGTRISMLTISGKRSKWNRNIVASLISEWGNEISWVVVTGIWLTH
jgi:hypothetical protein